MRLRHVWPHTTFAKIWCVEDPPGTTQRHTTCSRTIARKAKEIVRGCFAELLPLIPSDGCWAHSTAPPITFWTQELLSPAPVNHQTGSNMNTDEMSTSDTYRDIGSIIEFADASVRETAYDHYWSKVDTSASGLIDLEALRICVRLLPLDAPSSSVSWNGLVTL
jgi:hypothetical protein